MSINDAFLELQKDVEKFRAALVEAKIEDPPTAMVRLEWFDGEDHSVTLEVASDGYRQEDLQRVGLLQAGGGRGFCWEVARLVQ